MASRNPWLRPAGTDGLVPVRVLWDRFAALYGEKWRGLFADEPARAAWGEEAGALLYGRGIRWQLAMVALERLRGSVTAESVPPSLAEFADLALPAMDFGAAFDEARAQAPLEEMGRAHWSSAAVYWAARDFGFHRVAMASWSRNKSEWMRLLSARVAGDCPPIPTRMAPPAYQRGDPQVARAALSDLKARLGVA
ncbi:hypothetical protein [Chitiniphilus eburneus]|uniref:hypothetical protein n=1 Tax=Chitiniphilus eburneus TaxID=2571148 RepID=UPI0035CEAEF6